MRFLNRQSLHQHRRTRTSSIPPKLGLSSYCLFLLFFLPCFFPHKATADAVFINFPAFFGQNSGFSSSTENGSSSESSFSGNLIRVGAFSDNPTALIGGLTAITSPSTILANLESKFTQYTSFTFSDTLLSADTPVYPTTDDFGVPLVTQPSIGASLRGKDIYLLFYNAATTGAADQLAIFRMKDASMNGPTGSDLAGIFSTATGADGQYTSSFNLNTSEADMLLGQYLSSSDTFVLGRLSGGVGQIYNEDESAASGTPFSQQVLNNFGANQFSATGLPSSLSINSSTGLISGTFGGGTFTISAINTVTGKIATKILTYSLNAVRPVISGLTPNNATFGASADITINIDNGASEVSVAGLPPGLQHAGGASIKILGTPTVAGPFSLAITAINSSGRDVQNYTLTVLPGSAPDIQYTGTENNSGKIVATQFKDYRNDPDTSKHIYKFVTDLDGDPIRKPNSYTLPANTKTALNSIGIYLDEQTGVLYGIPTERTDLQLPITIANAAISATKNFTLSVQYAAPELAMPGNTSINEFVSGKPVKLPLIFSSQSVVSEIDGTDFAGQFSGLVLNVNQLKNATITGTPTQVQSAGAKITLKNADQTTDLLSALTLRVVADSGQPSLNGEVEYVFSVGTRVSVQLTADKGGSNFEKVEGTLPPGITLTPAGLLSGTPTTAGTYAPRIRTSNNVGPGPGQLFRMVVSEDPPTINSPSVTTGTINSPFSFTLLASPNPTAFQISSGTLPEGLSLSADTGVIAGTPEVSGTFVVGVQARNSKGLGPVSTLTFSLAGIPPAITSVLTTTGNAEQPFRYQIVASNEATSYSVTGTLPNGLSLNPSTGLISGTPTSVFEGTVTITATNASGSDNETLNIVINPVVVILTSTEVAGTVGTPLSFQLTANPSNDLVYSVGKQKLPTGLEITSTGLITGTPLSAESSAVTLKVVRGGQTTEDSRYTKVNFSFANTDFVAPNAVDGVLTFRAGEAGRTTISAPANFVITSVATDGVPEGLSWDGTALAGTPTTATRTAAKSKISFTASLSTALGTATISKSFQITVSGTPASLDLPSSLEIEVGKETKIPLPYEGTDVQFSYSGLPDGISI